MYIPFFLEPKSFGSAGLWPASGRPAGGGAGALAREAADGLLLSCCSEGAERGAGNALRGERSNRGEYALTSQVHRFPIGTGI